jgi:predicted enzyme related to lactoylglutathione lyase
MKVERMDHTVVHFEIPANDTEKLRKFYSGVFGWKIERFPGPKRLLDGADSTR